MARARIAGISLMLALVLLASCAPQAAPAAAPAPQSPAPVAKGPAPAATVPSAPAKPAWQEDWDKTVAAAKQEGSMLMYTGAGPTIRAALYSAFLDKFGIKIESVAGRAQELAEKVLAERRAGIYVLDVAVLSAATTIPALKPKGVLEKLDPFLVLPEVTDPKVWRGGPLWLDADHTVFGALNYQVAPIVINTELVKPEELLSYRDLLNAKFKGKIILDYPVGSGTGASLWMMIGGKIMGWDFVREFATKQEPTISRDWRQELEWVARGKMLIGMGLSPDYTLDFIRLGAPIKPLIPKEGTYGSSGSGTVSIATKAPHPNAAKVFANWFLSKEGQTFAVQTFRLPSGRLDVSTEGIDSSRVPQAGVNYYYSNKEDFITESASYGQKVNEIFFPK